MQTHADEHRLDVAGSGNVSIRSSGTLDVAPEDELRQAMHRAWSLARGAWSVQPFPGHAAKTIFRNTLIVAALAVSASSAAHADALRLGYAHGQDTDDYGIEVRFDRDAPLREFKSSLLTTAVDVGLGVFQGHKHPSEHNNVKTLFVTGTIRWSRAPTGPVQPFAEFGLGLSALSEQSINGNRSFGSSFEFNELIRLGLRFGARRQYEVTIGGQHFSNAGLHPPNDGITYAAVTGAWYWR